MSACAPAWEGASHGRPSFRVLLFPQAPHWVQITVGRALSSLARVCPLEAKAIAESAKPLPEHRWWRRYGGTVAQVM